jgi:DNA polymerase III alpha subunit
MSRPSYNTVLKNRTLWYDGDSSYPSKFIIQAIKKGHKVKWVDSITQDIAQYNNVSSKEDCIDVKQCCNDLQFDWNIPDEYKSMNVIEYIMDQHEKLVIGMDEEEIAKREIRLATELTLYCNKKFTDILRTIIYIINTLTSAGVIWGVGRGSSVSSYILYIIGVHDVDSYYYNLDIEDFLHD